MAASIRKRRYLAGRVIVTCGIRRGCSSYEIALLTGMYKHQRLKIRNKCASSVNTAFKLDKYREIHAVGLNPFLARITVVFILGIMKFEEFFLCLPRRLWSAL